jgi:hypothetical protein
MRAQDAQLRLMQRRSETGSIPLVPSLEDITPGFGSGAQRGAEVEGWVQQVVRNVTPIDKNN